MSWQTLEFELESAAAEQVGDVLLGLGALSVSLEDALAGTPAEQPVFDEPGQPRAAFQRARTKVLLDPAIDAGALLREACQRCAVTVPAAWNTYPVAEQDWVRSTQDQFQPIRIVPGFWIVPTWHEAPEPLALNITLDPGLAFGTGGHPTTRLCLGWLHAVVRRGDEVLDFGCGSGILAVAAAKLGAGRVWGIDIDAQAVRSAQLNAAQNGVCAQFGLTDQFADRPADIVVANILANPLRVLAPLLKQRVRPGGQLALAGLLIEQAEDLITCYRPEFDMQVEAQEDGWALLVGRRITAPC